MTTFKTRAGKKTKQNKTNKQTTNKQTNKTTRIAIPTTLEIICYLSISSVENKMTFMNVFFCLALFGCS